MSADPRIDEIIKRLGNIEETLDSLAESFDSEISAVRQEIDRATKAAENAPNRTGTVLEKNQQTIWKGVSQAIAALQSIGVTIEEVKEEQENAPQQ